MRTSSTVTKVSVSSYLDDVDDPSLRPFEAEPVTDATPEFVQPVAEGLSLAQAVELELDQDVIWIVSEASDAVTTHAALLAGDGVAVEGFLPCVEVADLVLDLEDWHGPRLPSSDEAVEPLCSSSRSGCQAVSR
jgi:hypothetical protein